MQIFKNTKEIIYLVIAIAFGYKIVQIDINSISLPDNLTNLISLSLAIFSISLSALFYFKANDSNNQFYNNTYQFTKDISEKIGRIEERFGKDLSNIEKNYTRMLDRMERISIPEVIESEIEIKTIDKNKLSQERKQIIEEVLQRANISEEEKQILIRQLNAKELELDEVKKELYELKNQIEESQYSFIVPPHTKNVLKFLINSIKHGGQMPRRFGDLISHFEERIRELEDKDKHILINEEIINERLKITNKGQKVILELL